MQENNQEIWKPVKNYEGLYEISNLGNVRSLDRDMCGRKEKGKTLKGINRKGYLAVNLTACGKRRHSKSIHRLVLESFVPNPLNKCCVNHINGNKKDNNLSNLEWTTNIENSRHAIKTGLVIVKKGDERHTSKLTYKKADEIRELAARFNYPILAYMFSVSKATICNVVNKKYWVR